MYEFIYFPGLHLSRKLDLPPVGPVENPLHLFPISPKLYDNAKSESPQYK